MRTTKVEEVGTFKLRFYLGETKSRRKENDKILNLLQEVRKKHGVDYEVFNLRITEDGYVDENHEKEVYEAHFKPRAKVLKQRIGESLPRSLRSRGGRGHYYISGVMAILEDGQVGWYTSWQSCQRFQDFDQDLKAGFLKSLLFQGPILLRELCPNLDLLKSSHDFLMDEFIKANPLKGKLERETKVGSMIFNNKVGASLIGEKP